MRRTSLAILSTALIFAFAGTSHAGWEEFWHGFHVDYHRNNAWPAPFQHASREVTRAPFMVMMNNGWQLHNTIHAPLFHPETQQLTRAGQQRVNWILNEAPRHRRTVYVLRGRSQEETNIRLDSVQQWITRIVPQGSLPPVLLTDVSPSVNSGDYFDRMGRKMMDVIPEPKLPAMTAGDGGGN